jgi:hypothetical protein
MRRRNVAAIALGVLFTALAGYWFTIGRHEIADADELEPEPAA